MNANRLPSRKRDAIFTRFDRVKNAFSSRSAPDAIPITGGQNAPSSVPSSVLGTTSKAGSSTAISLHEESFKQFEALNPKDAELLRVHIDPQASATWHSQTQSFIESQLAKARQDRLKVQLSNGKVLLISNMLGKFTKWIRMMVAVGDSAVQFDPVHAALPWAAFRFVLQSTLNYQEADSAVWDGIEAICTELVWVNLQESLYLDDALKANLQLRKALIAFYIELFTGAVARILLSPFVSKASFQHHLENVGKTKKLVESFSLQAARETQIGQSAKIKQVLDCLGDLKAPVDRLQAINEEMYSRMEQKDHEDLLNWISDVQQANHFSRAVSRALKGTGQWFFDSDQYKQWKGSSTAEILRFHGKAGSGKSTLFSILLKNLQQESEAAGLPPPIYFYCARTTEEPKRAEPVQVLRCLLKQLSQIPGSSKVHSSVHERYMQRSTQGELQEEEIIKLCLNSIDSRGPTFILIDALDESDSASRDVLLSGLVQILKEAEHLVKIFVTSRDSRYEGMILKYPELVVMPHDNANDIELYIDSELDWMDRQGVILNGEMSYGLRYHIKTRLSEKADGMFRWVALQLQTLKHFVDESLVREHLGNLTADLSESYRNLFEFEMRHLDRHLPGVSQIARRTFKWLMIAQKQISSSEFRTLVGHVAADHSPKPTEHLLQHCFSLVEYDQTVDAFRFCHLSVREFFESPHFKEAHPDFEDLKLHAQAANTCLEVVVAGSEAIDCTLFRYASAYWPYHARQAGEQREGQMLGEKICDLLADSRAFQAWSSSYGELWRGERERLTGRDWTFTRRWQPLMIVVLWNLIELMPRFSADLDIQALAGMSYRSENNYEYGLLDCAAYLGYDKMMTALFDIGMNINCLGDARYALLVAVAKGNLNAVELLLKNGSHFFQAYVIEEALADAARLHDNGDMARLILKHGPSSFTKEHLDTAFMSAVQSGGDMKIITLLLDCGADVNSSDKNGRTALMWASWESFNHLVRFLLAQGAKIDVKDSTGLDALQFACAGSRSRPELEVHETIDLLLKHGADPDTRRNDGETALMTALSISGAQGGTSGVCIAALLAAGADADAVNESGRNVLEMALEQALPETVHMLLDHRAASGKPFDDEREVLSLANAAARAGKEARQMIGILSYRLYRAHFDFDRDGIVKGLEKMISWKPKMKEVSFLIELGTITKADLTHLFQRLMYRYSENFNWKESTVIEDTFGVARYLCMLGADVDGLFNRSGYEPDWPDSWQTPLMCAIQCVDLDMMYMLLDHGANVEAEIRVDLDSSSGLSTALEQACRSGELEAIKAILDNGGDVNRMSCRGDTPLAIATSVRDEGAVSGAKSLPVMELLLAHGADVNSPSNHNVSALGEAAYYGNMQAVELLLARGADVNLTRTTFGGTSSTLVIAAYQGDVEILRRLLEHRDNAGVKVDMNYCGTDRGTPLIATVSYCRIAAAELLLEHGADINVESQLGTALTRAAHLRDRKMVEFLVKHGAVAGIRGPWTMAWCVRNAKLDDDEDDAIPIVEMLCKQGTDPMKVTYGPNALEAALTKLEAAENGVVSSNLREKARTARVMSNCKKLIAILRDHGAETRDSFRRGQERRRQARENRSFEVDGLSVLFDMDVG